MAEKRSPMRNLHLSILLPCPFLLFGFTGCAHHYYPPPPPPPPQAYQQVPPLILLANRFGVEAGRQDGARDAFEQTGYHPRNDRRFVETPGYDPNLGPFAPYRDTFRSAYLHAYDMGFRGR